MTSYEIYIHTPYTDTYFGKTPILEQKNAIVNNLNADGKDVLIVTVNTDGDRLKSVSFHK